MTRRVVRAATAVAALVLLAAPIPASSAPAQTAGTVTTAKAIAVVASYVPSMGNLRLAITTGASVAELRNQLAQSQAQFLDFGLIGNSLTAIPCENDDIAGQDPLGDDPSVKPSDLPQPVRVDNRGGDASNQAAEAEAPGSVVSGGLSQVRATTVPAAEAVSTSSRVSLGAVVVNGGRATAATEVVDGGAARLARASVELDLDIPNVLHLRGLRWEAIHRTGTSPEAGGTFSIGTAEVLGQAVPVEGVPTDQVIAALSDALAPLGMSFGHPEVQHFTEPSDFVRVTPLALRFVNSTLGPLFVSPILEATQQVRDDLVNRLHDEQCRSANVVTVAEIVLGPVSGIGNTTLNLGGVEVTSGSAELGNPFGDGGLLAPPLDLPPLDVAASVAAPAPAGSTALPTASPTAPTPTPLAAQPAGSFERVCESVHPFEWPSCSSGAAPFAAVAAVVATAGIAALDWRHQRRRGRMAP